MAWTVGIWRYRRDRQQLPPVAWCACCGGEVWLRGRTVCRRCEGSGQWTIDNASKNIVIARRPKVDVAIRKFFQCVALRRPMGGKGNGLPRQCAHWLAMTTIFEGAVGQARNDRGRSRGRWGKCKMQSAKCKIYRVRQFCIMNFEFGIPAFRHFNRKGGGG